MKISPGDRPHSLFADCLDSTSPVEIFSIEKQKSRLIAAENTVMDGLIDHTKNAIEASTKWLPFFAEVYNISADINDYLMVPVVIMPSDLPNRNNQAFPYTELVAPNVEAGCLGFETWSKKSVFQHHVNDYYTKSKGIIFSSALRPIKNSKGNLWKVICLLGVDRRTQPILANSILTGETKYYSMGAYASHFTCSVCGSKHTAKQTPCEHVSLQRPSRTLQIFNGKPAYLKANNILGFEVSAVNTPAYVSAETPPDKVLVWDSKN